jgi:hypothetical protein
MRYSLGGQPRPKATFVRGVAVLTGNSPGRLYVAQQRDCDLCPAPLETQWRFTPARQRLIQQHLPVRRHPQLARPGGTALGGKPGSRVTFAAGDRAVGAKGKDGVLEVDHPLLVICRHDSKGNGRMPSWGDVPPLSRVVVAQADSQSRACLEHGTL